MREFENQREQDQYGYRPQGIQDECTAHGRQPDRHDAEEQEGGAQHAALVAFQSEREGKANGGTEKDQGADKIRFDEDAADADKRRKEKRHSFEAAARRPSEEAEKIVPGEFRPVDAASGLPRCAAHGAQLFVILLGGSAYRFELFVEFAIFVAPTIVALVVAGRVADIVPGLFARSGAPFCLRFFPFLSLVVFPQLVDDEAVRGIEFDHRLVRAAGHVGMAFFGRAAKCGFYLVEARPAFDAENVIRIVQPVGLPRRRLFRLQLTDRRVD